MSREFREADIVIHSTHHQNGDIDTIKEKYKGNFRDKDGELIALYTDNEGKRIQLKCSGKVFEKKQMGSALGKFTAEPGRDTSFEYQTVYGKLDFICRCHSLEVNSNVFASKVTLSYSLLAEGEELSRVEMKIDILGK